MFPDWRSGKIRVLAFPPTGDPGAYALVGMGTLFAGIIRAPMTSVFMIFEITQDYQILVPLMVANLLSYAISRHYQPIPVYDALLRQDHIHLPSAAARPPGFAGTAHEVMNREPSFLPGELPVDEAWQTAQKDGCDAYLVGTRERLAGVVTVEHLAAARDAGRGSDSVASLVSDRYVHVHPDHTFEVVMERFADSPELLPVVSREDMRRVEGVVTADDLTRYVRGRREKRRSRSE